MMSSYNPRAICYIYQPPSPPPGHKTFFMMKNLLRKNDKLATVHEISIAHKK